MSDPYVGEIRMFGGNFAPNGWLLCQGQLLPISEYDTLFNLIGTTYGGDGQETFALPNLASRLPVHQGSGYQLGESGGAEDVQLLPSQLPVHTHSPLASTSAGSQVSPRGGVWSGLGQPGYAASPTSAMSAAALTAAGGSQPHDNMSPYLAVNFIISLYGIYPSPS